MQHILNNATSIRALLLLLYLYQVMFLSKGHMIYHDTPAALSNHLTTVSKAPLPQVKLQLTLCKKLSLITPSLPL
jgi:hypothetical protein